jgi:LPXTG-site transpeptidase (sortase) family protein
MFIKFQIFVMILGGLLALLGFAISVDAAISGILDTRPTVSPFDQANDMMDRRFTSTFNLNMSDPKDRGQAASPAGTPVQTWIPDRLFIPSIDLDAPVIPAELRTIEYNGDTYPQWTAPDYFAAGWSLTSGSLGIPGNTVFFGHHNINGRVFEHLIDLEINDLIVVYSGEKKFVYGVMSIMILEERNQPLNVRLENARWLLQSQDERVTLLTCWPESSNTHRLIVVASPLPIDNITNYVITPRRSEAQSEWGE